MVSMQKILILLSIITLYFATYVSADNKNDTLSKLDIKKLYKKAIHNDIEASYKLGLAYANGDGVKQDEDEAKKWLRLSADQGHEPSKQLLERLSQP